MEKTTVDHKEIRSWVELYKGQPQLLDHKNANADTVGIRVAFPVEGDSDLLSTDSPPTNIDWEEFFRLFEEQELHFIYTDGKIIGDPGYHYRFAKRSEL